MNTSQTSKGATRTARTIVATFFIAALTAAVTIQPAAARQDAGPSTSSTSASSSTSSSPHCSLQRVGTQFVLCDDLTGNGVPAPAWVDER